MLINSRIARVFCTVSVIFALSAMAFADTIRLKDGSMIKGRIVSFSGGKFTIAIGEGSRRRELSYAAAEVESIQFDSPAVPAVNTARVNRPMPVPVSTPVRQEPAVQRPDAEDASDIVADDGTVAETANEQPATPAPVRRSTTPSPMSKPVQFAVKVLADDTSNGWTNTGWVVKKGQRIKVTGDGRVSLGRGQSTDPSGLSELEDSGKLMRAVPTGALIAVIGDDNNDFIYIGAEREFTAERDGALFLGVNEGNLGDNTGAFNVNVEVAPDSSE